MRETGRALRTLLGAVLCLAAALTFSHVMLVFGRADSVHRGPGVGGVRRPGEPVGTGPPSDGRLTATPLTAVASPTDVTSTPPRGDGDGEAAAPTCDRLGIAPAGASGGGGPDDVGELANGALRLPRVYPLHRRLPPRRALRCGLARALRSTAARCPASLVDPRGNATTKRGGGGGGGASHAPPPPFLWAAADAADERRFAPEDAAAGARLAAHFGMAAPHSRPFWGPGFTGAPGDANDRDPDGRGDVDGEDDGDGGALPCTAAIQRRLYAYQFGDSPGGGDDSGDGGDGAGWCQRQRLLVTKLKQGAHGVGSAVTLLAHDMLAAIILGRRLAITAPSSGWYFAPAVACGGRAWTCFFLPAGRCRPATGAVTVGSKKDAAKSTAAVIVKRHFDVPGLSRDDAPTLRDFLGEALIAAHPRCVRRIEAWVGGGKGTAAAEAMSARVMGSFGGGGDPLLYFMLAQATRFLMRGAQPWFAAMLAAHAEGVLPPTHRPRLLPPSPSSHAGVDDSDGATGSDATRGTTTRRLPPVDDSTLLVYVQDRGEVAKYREYYNTLACHTFNATAGFPAIARAIRRHRRGGNDDHGRRRGDGLRRAAAVAVYVSGNTPRPTFDALAAALAADGVPVFSTWRSPLLRPGRAAAAAPKDGAGDTARWGAAHPAAAWLDLWVGAGGAAGGWACIVQSNWCRVIDFLRLTSARRGPPCPFVDIGVLLLADPPSRRAFCVARPGEWPTKPFSNAGPAGTLAAGDPHAASPDTAAH